MRLSQFSQRVPDTVQRHKQYSPQSPSLISLMVSVDVKHHVNLLTLLSELRSCVKVEVDVLGSHP